MSDSRYGEGETQRKRESRHGAGEKREKEREIRCWGRSDSRHCRRKKQIVTVGMGEGESEISHGKGRGGESVEGVEEGEKGRKRTINGPHKV